MNRFICQQCGRYCYSAGRLEDLRNDLCIYPWCDGHLVYVGIADGRRDTDEDDGRNQEDTAPSHTPRRP